ncbi:MAG: reverse transcriptase family protein [Acidobacteriota bacterium]
MSRYPIHQSGLFRLRSIGQLARLLRYDSKTLRALSDVGKHYHVWPETDANGKERIIEAPQGQLKVLHRRLVRIVNRIQLPEYLHSGRKKRSYITNAEAHVSSRTLIKLDIRKFYPSTSTEAFVRGLRDYFECGVEVADLLGDLCTFEGHIPTGSPFSMMAAYVALKSRFDRAAAAAKARGNVFTVYVDDMTLSGSLVNNRDRDLIKSIFKGSGLDLHKFKYYGPTTAKSVTGTILRDGRKHLPNRRHLKIATNLALLESLPQGAEKERLYQSVRGQMIEASQLEPSYAHRLRRIE